MTIRKSGEAEVMRCSFCDKPQNDVRKLIAGPSVFICDECVQVGVDIIADDSRFEARRNGASPPPDSVQRGQVALSSSSSIILRCALCKMPLISDEALLVDARGALCPGCTGAIEAALAERNTPEE